MSTPHNVKNIGDFESCTNPDCKWSATWSMGMLCDYCQKPNCKCPCPLTDVEINKIMKRRAKVGDLTFGDWYIYIYPTLKPIFDDSKESAVMQGFRYGKRVEIFNLYDFGKKYGGDKLMEVLKDKVAGYKAGYDEV